MGLKGSFHQLFVKSLRDGFMLELAERLCSDHLTVAVNQKKTPATFHLRNDGSRWQRMGTDPGDSAGQDNEQ